MKLVEVDRPKFIMLVGVPGSGKSTWINSFVSKSPEEWIVMSTDDIIEDWAKKNGKTYSEAFAILDFKDIQSKFDSKLKTALQNKQNIIWDQTNIQSGARKKKLSQIPSFYQTAAIAFEVSEDELMRRLADRSNNTGKTIPDTVIRSMIRNYQPPSKSEGFETVHFIRN